MKTETQTAELVSVASTGLVRHCCGSCIYHVTGHEGGWGRFASPENPRKTEWCVVCDHRAEGVNMPVYRHKWGGFRILPTHPSGATGSRSKIMNTPQDPAGSRLAPTTGSQFPRIVCLCGSSRLYREYQEAEYRETMAGRIYLSIGFYPHAAPEMHGEGVEHDGEEKIALDELHKRKIDLANEVLVLNVGGYIGDSTKSEVAYALETGKPVRWLEPESAWSPDTANAEVSDAKRSDY